MLTKHHILLSTIISIPFYYIGEPWMALSCLFMGIFIDVDHQLDFYLLFGKFTMSINELNNELLEHNRDNFFCPLHSWEFMILLLILSIRFNVFIGAFVGAFTHLLADILFNEQGPQDLFLRFSFFYRARNQLKQYEEFRRNYSNKK